MSDIIYYEDYDFVQEVKENKYSKYLLFTIAECTESALEEKCNFILSKQGLNWKPLYLEYKTHIKIYEKVFYFEKK